MRSKTLPNVQMISLKNPKTFQSESPSAKKSKRKISLIDSARHVERSYAKPAASLWSKSDFCSLTVWKYMKIFEKMRKKQSSKRSLDT